MTNWSKWFCIFLQVFWLPLSSHESASYNSTKPFHNFTNTNNLTDNKNKISNIPENIFAVKNSFLNKYVSNKNKTKNISSKITNKDVNKVLINFLKFIKETPQKIADKNESLDKNSENNVKLKKTTESKNYIKNIYKNKITQQNITESKDDLQSITGGQQNITEIKSTLHNIIESKDALQNKTKGKNTLQNISELIEDDNWLRNVHPNSTIVKSRKKRRFLNFPRGSYIEVINV